MGAKLACRSLADEDDASQIHPRVTKKFLEMMVYRKISPAQQLLSKNHKLIKNESFTSSSYTVLKNLLFAQDDICTTSSQHIAVEVQNAPYLLYI